MLIAYLYARDRATELKHIEGIHISCHFQMLLLRKESDVIPFLHKHFLNYQLAGSLPVSTDLIDRFKPFALVPHIIRAR